MNCILDQGHTRIKDTVGAIITIEAKEEAIHHLKKEVLIKETITSCNKKDHILNNLIYNNFLMILTRTDLKISILIKVEVCLFNLFHRSNLGKSKKTDFLIIEILLRNI